jgi:hypothetical protein
VTVVAGLGLDELLGLRELDRAGVEERFGIANVADDVRYEGLAGLDRLDPETLHAHFFFAGDRQVMLYVPEGSLEDAHPAALEAELGPPAAALRSRTGERSAVYAYPERGIAFATDGERVELLEVFRPTTLERYEAEIYRDPGEFIR